jgi:UrcA family protein
MPWIGLAVAALTLAAFADPALAREPRGGELRASVRYDGLDLTSETGAQIVLRRIRTAAGRICGSPAPDRREFAHRAAFNACVQSVTDRAVRRLDAPAVSALHFGPQRFAGR